MPATEKLYQLLTHVRDHAPDDFSGVGVVLCQDVSSLPAFPLDPSFRVDASLAARDLILALASSRSPHHDGFHFLDESLRVTHVCQYVAPPVELSAVAALPARVGARYVTALLASRLPTVIATGIVGSDRSIHLFQRGEPLQERSA